MLDSIKFITVKSIKIAYETFGDPSHPAVVLLMGNSAQGLMWDESFCRQLAANRYFVIRFDYRDTGLSTCLDYDSHPYNLDDLTQDVLALMDQLSIERAHFIGLSMGGAIAQLLALYHLPRVLTISLMMTSPDLSVKNNAFKGIRSSHAMLPPPSADFIQQVIEINKCPAANDAEKLQQLIDNWRLANGGKAPFDDSYWRNLLGETMKREAANPTARDLKFANLGNHSKAQMASPEPNLEVIRKIDCPCLIIHGEEDPIFPVEHAKALEDGIRNSRFHLIKTMGHALNPCFFEEMISAIHGHLA
ncbi:alpha/beta hydrolase [Legionella birminghamensis]|uniref:Alpha/beta hydrolase n=1 Tax=Legionella birminghamensis TaxID=28083 RepID=A0A378I850_9GAMM|nr:alpha/beta hydrolase [Legionella birminghamensis]KTC68321.1 alpha/beta hydrolase [Legionella birminghamensis]STX30966.1 alpha/beta hydrolase [Legionella birminghamensis]